MMEMRLKSAYLELLFVCLCLLTGETLGQENGETVIRVKVGSEAVLPCFIRPEKDITGDVFDWKKDGQNVFFYERSQHYNNGREGQDEQFKGRVSHLPDQLQSGNASIVIRDTKLSDSGTYTCDYSPGQPDSQTFTVELNVVAPCPTPQIMTLNQTRDEVQLQCEVRGASTKSKVEWQDGSGNVLPAEETLVPNPGGSNNIILKTTVTRTGNYRCVATQEGICHQGATQTFVNIPGSEPITDPEPTEGETVIRVKVGSEAVLPCFIRPERDITGDVFDWRKDDQKEVFYYENGKHHNNGLPGQDEQFKGRVSHLPDQLQSGNASIVIRDTMVSDSGTYTCDYSPGQPNSQTFTIKLNVVAPCPFPRIMTLSQTRDEVQLLCEVRGASPESKVEWQDGSGNVLPAEETLVPTPGGSHNIILKTTVTKTGNYRCVATQEGICHQGATQTFVNIPGPE